ncbi:MAG: PepSY domain-containing protein, partial [Micromonosporaceae bacterium]
DVDTALPGGAGAPPPGSGTGSHHGSGSGSDSGSGSGSGSSGGGEVDATRIDAVVAAARGAGLDGPVVVTPAATGQAWVVTQDDDVWPVRYDELAVDPATGAVVAENRWQDWPVMAQLSRLGIQFHMGKLFGLANQLLLAAVAVGLLAMIFWGYRMWWQRRPTRTGGWVGRPPARGAWRSVPATWLALGAVVLGAVAWALPLLGVTLAAFLLLDVALGTLARHRAT